MSIGTAITEKALKHAKLITALIVLGTVSVAALAVLPTVWPEKFPALSPLQVDTDPENMLRRDEPHRAFHRRMKEELNLHDMVVVGVVNEKDENGVFNPQSLRRIYELTHFALSLQWPDPERPGEIAGVIRQDAIAPSLVDNIEQAGPATVRFEWLMPKPPQTPEEAQAVREKAQDIPFLDGTLVSEDGRAVGIYLPLTAKDVSYRIYDELRGQIPVLFDWAVLDGMAAGLDVVQDEQQSLADTRDTARTAARYSESREQFANWFRELTTALSSASEPDRIQLDSMLKQWKESAAAYVESERESLTGAVDEFNAAAADFREQLETTGAVASLDDRDPWGLDNSSREVWQQIVQAEAQVEETAGLDPEKKRQLLARLDSLKKTEKKLHHERISAARKVHQMLQQKLESDSADNGSLLLQSTLFHVRSLTDRGLTVGEIDASVNSFADRLSGLLSRAHPWAERYHADSAALIEQGMPGDDEFYITGLPVAEDTFGVQMFKQMAISAPTAMLVIFILMMLFFRKFALVISPLIVALICVIWAMGLLIATGNTVHIMSSMIPIFIMPIAVLDSVHILSEFFDRYQQTHGRRKTIKEVMDSLFVPMLYTSLTSAAGFASLALTPIPPVQPFGLFVAFGVMLAWLLTVTFIPAYVTFLPERTLENFGATHREGEAEKSGVLGRLLPKVGRATHRGAKAILLATAVIIVISIWGISQININDNPTKWFEPSHPIRVADKKLNEHFGGTYMAYLLLESDQEELTAASYAPSLRDALEKQGEDLKAELPEAPEVFGQVAAMIEETDAATAADLLRQLREEAAANRDKAPDETYYGWDEAVVFLEGRLNSLTETFKNPEVLRYIGRLQQFMNGIKWSDKPTVGKSNSLADIVKTVYRELVSGKPEDQRVPDSSAAVAQTLIQYQNSHRPQDLWHFVTPDYQKSNIWLQLKSGDNQGMQVVTEAVAGYVEDNPPPVPLNFRWFGLTYINVVWQEKMVVGMLQAFAGSFLIVFLMMTLLFRSSLWGGLCMVPLLVTIGFIYGFIGIIGKDYDMPTAVLSSLSLGLAVDFAIHFLARSRALYSKYGKWSKTIGPVFDEPARAISRNIIVIAVGFLPLLAAPLVPYQTVGMLIATILAVAGVATLFILPALITLMEKMLFPAGEKMKFTCKCGTCIISSIALVALVAINLHQFMTVGWTMLTWISVPAVIVLAVACGLMSRRRACGVEQEQASPES